MSQSQLETQSNAYATINKLPMAPSSRRSLFNGSLGLEDREYATLDKSSRSPIGPVVPGIHPTPAQSNTIPRRVNNQYSGYNSPGENKRSGSNMFLNQDGEWQLVGELM